EVFATAPLVILLFDRCVTGQSWRAIFKTRWLAYFLVMSPFVWFVPSVLRWFDPSRSTSMGFGLKSVSSWEYLRTQPEIILHYLRLSCWPDPLCFDYAWRVQQNPILYLSLGMVILLLLTAGAWLYVTGLGESDGEATPSQSTAKGIAGWLILTFFLMLAPTSSFMPIADLCVEHRMYLPLAVVVSGVCLFANRVRIALEAKSQHPGVVTAGMMLGLLACLTLLAWRTDLRNREYRDGIALWKSVLSVRPENPRAWFMLGSEYFGRDRFEEALPLYEKAVSFQMPIGEFYAGLADCLRELGQPDAAVENYQRAIELTPSLAKAHNGLGVVRQRQGNLDAAQGAFQQAHDLGLPEARYNLANVLIEQGELAAAVPLLEESLAEHPDFVLAARRLAWILATAPQQDLRDGQRARELLDRHYRVDESDSPFVWDTHAAILAEQRQFEEAVSAAQHALARATEREDPDLAAAIQKRLEGYRQRRPWREEATRIEKTLTDLLRQFTGTVVVVDDASRDDTSLRVARFPVWQLQHPINCGQGAALQTGIEFALRQGAEVIVTFDADGQHDASEIPRLVAAVASGEVDTIRIQQPRMAHASEILEEIANHQLRYREVPVTDLEMNLFQWLTVPVLIGLALVDLLSSLRNRRHPRLLRTAACLIAAGLILYPQAATTIARSVGSGAAPISLYTRSCWRQQESCCTSTDASSRCGVTLWNSRVAKHWGHQFPERD
ncbi:Protein O-mannosyl-transferase TMTC2 (Transmembrane and TPR repeat-containing protein CG4341), partial [Durusdinium trenchii]